MTGTLSHTQNIFPPFSWCKCKIMNIGLETIVKFLCILIKSFSKTYKLYRGKRACNKKNKVSHKVSTIKLHLYSNLDGGGNLTGNIVQLKYRVIKLFKYDNNSTSKFSLSNKLSNTWIARYAMEIGKFCNCLN